MAVPVAEFNSVSRSGYDKMVIKTQYEDSPLYKLLDARKRIFRGGLDERIPIQYRKLQKTRAVNPRAAVTYSSRDTITQVKIEPRFVVAEVSLTWRDIQSNKRESQIVDIVRFKSEELADDFADTFHEFLYTTTQDPEAVDSLATLISSGTLYGLPVGAGDAEQWKSVVVAAAWAPKFFGKSTVDGSQSLAQLINGAKFGKKRPTHVVSSRDMHTSLGNLWNRNHGEFMYDGQAKTLGIENFRFKGCTFVEDYRCPDSQIHGLDLDGGLVCMEDPKQPQIKDWFSLEQAGRPNDMVKYMDWVGNFAIQQRRTSFRIAAATIPTAAAFNNGNLA